ncbi:MAG: homocitrate synthase/isopropylmalate synthase family protein, partial [Bacteroidota bacterium]
RTVRLAKDFFQYVSIGAQDGSRSNPGHLYSFLQACQHLRVHRVRIADTVGILNPISTYQLMQQVKNQFPDLRIEFHGHNDFGMATANAIAALQGGAECISATVNGLGERAGNAALEEVIMGYKHTVNPNINYNTPVITRLCKYVTKASKRSLPASKPIVGNMALRHETGIHIKGILKNRKTYQPFEASEIGRREHPFIFGKHSGKAGLVDCLNEKTTADAETIDAMLQFIKKTAEQKKRNLTHQELQNIIGAFECESKVKK